VSGAPVNDGGPAFPGEQFTGQVEYVEGVGSRMLAEPVPGMSLRDYFAAQVVQGLFAGDAGSEIGCRREHFHLRAGVAYAMADAMLKAREVRE
jgi:hypothetical protein